MYPVITGDSLAVQLTSNILYEGQVRYWPRPVWRFPEQVYIIDNTKEERERLSSVSL